MVDKLQSQFATQQCLKEQQSDKHKKSGSHQNYMKIPQQGLMLSMSEFLHVKASKLGTGTDAVVSSAINEQKQLNLG